MSQSKFEPDTFRIQVRSNNTFANLLNAVKLGLCRTATNQNEIRGQLQTQTSVPNFLCSFGGTNHGRARFSRNETILSIFTK
jgi:hypothetical protein